MNETIYPGNAASEVTDTAFDSDRIVLEHLVTLLSQCEEDPVEGLAGYLVTEDPTYLPDDSEIKCLIRMMGRDKLLRLILNSVLPSQSSPKGV